MFTISNTYIAPGHGHTTIWYKFWQHLKAFMIPIILYQFQKDPFCLNILLRIGDVCCLPAPAHQPFSSNSLGLSDPEEAFSRNICASGTLI